MKKSIIISATLIAGASLAAYLFKKYSTTKQPDNNKEPRQRSHHLTNYFSKAKKHSVEMA